MAKKSLLNSLSLVFKKLSFFAKMKLEGPVTFQIIPKRIDKVTKAIHLKPHIFIFEWSST